MAWRRVTLSLTEVRGVPGQVASGSIRQGAAAMDRAMAAAL